VKEPENKSSQPAMDLFGFFKKNVQAVSVLMKTPSKENPSQNPMPEPGI
jgi:hypothetical protein